MVSEPMQPLIVRLPPELHQAVKDAARAADLSMAQWIRRAIRAQMWTATLSMPSEDFNIVLDAEHSPDEKVRVTTWPSNLSPNVGDQTRAGA